MEKLNNKLSDMISKKEKAIIQGESDEATTKEIADVELKIKAKNEALRILGNRKKALADIEIQKMKNDKAKALQNNARQIETQLTHEYTKLFELRDSFNSVLNNIETLRSQANETKKEAGKLGIQISLSALAELVPPTRLQRFAKNPLIEEFFDRVKKQMETGPRHLR